MDYVRKRAEILQTRLNIAIFPDQLPSDAEEYHNMLREIAIRFTNENEHWLASQLQYELAAFFEESNPGFSIAYKRQADVNYRKYKQTPEQIGPVIRKQIDKALEAHRKRIEQE